MILFPFIKILILSFEVESISKSSPRQLWIQYKLRVRRMFVTNSLLALFAIKVLSSLWVLQCLFVKSSQCADVSLFLDSVLICSVRHQLVLYAQITLLYPLTGSFSNRRYLCFWYISSLTASLAILGHFHVDFINILLISNAWVLWTLHWFYR